MGLEGASITSDCSHSWKLLGWESRSSVAVKRHREETQVYVDKAHPKGSSVSQPPNVLVIALWEGPLTVLGDLGPLLKKYGFS